MHEIDEIANNVEALLLEAGWSRRKLSWNAARRIARVLMPTEGEVLRDNLAQSIRELR